eukprot:symbB.v1.2.033421.t1/scaffold4147.1/size43859/4
MGGCESCASGRRKEVERLIDDAKRHGDCRNLRDAIQRAEAEGMDVLAARQLYAEMAKNERQSPERAQEMLRWAASTQDGVILRQVIEEAWFACQTFETFKIFFFEICRSRHCVRIPCPWFQQGSACRSFRWVGLNELPNRLANELIPGGNQAANQPHPGHSEAVVFLGSCQADGHSLGGAW